LRLSQLLRGIQFQLLTGDIDVDIKGIYYDSRRVVPGSLFVCVSGFKTDGHLYIKQAVQKGAVAVIVEKEAELCEKDVTYLLTSSTRKALPVLASNFYQAPSLQMRVIGVTGTNGKTTTTHLIKAILEEAGKKTAVIGTLYAQIDGERRELGQTTPEALEIEDFMSFCRDKNAEYIVMEVSSHALDLYRVDKIDFNVAVYTNLSQDHLDYHKNMDNYKDAKLKLFRMIPRQPGNYSVINIDDAYSEEFIKAAGPSYYTYGLKKEADIKAKNLSVSLAGSRFTVKHKEETININMKLIGLFSAYNALAAIACALNEGISSDIVKSALEKVEGVPGRFEQVKCGQNFTVVVDYAHTPDGLENILRTGKQIAKKRIITVFGCGGDRDRGKRPLMGEIAARYSDFCIVTSDNPRSEEPEAIIADIIPGLHKVKGSHYTVITDRREAIGYAIHLAREGDLVIIAGKGHETYQLVKDRVLEFDDRKVAAEFLGGRENGG